MANYKSHSSYLVSLTTPWGTRSAVYTILFFEEIFGSEAREREGYAQDMNRGIMDDDLIGS
jgi:hypothetical protein